MAHDSFVVRAQAHHASKASRNHSGHRLAWDAGFLPIGAAGDAEQQDALANGEVGSWGGRLVIWHRLLWRDFHIRDCQAR